MAELARLQEVEAAAAERMRLLTQLEAAEVRLVAAVLERDTIRAELIAHIKDSAAATGACTSAVAAATAAATEPATEAASEAATDETDSPMPLTPP